MARINSALYKNEIIDAFEVDDNYNTIDRREFKCPDCRVKVAFNRGINELDPHFKNWPNTLHQIDCEIEAIQSIHKKNDNHQVQVLTSTILPRAERLKKIDSSSDKQKIIKRYFGKTSQKFLSAISSIPQSELKTISIRTEDRKTIPVTELIKRQDEIIDKLERDKESFVCIIKGFLTKKIEVGHSIKIPFTHGGKYGNKKEFDLFLPASFKNKNFEKLGDIENSLIYCYGLAEKNDYGYKMDLYSVTHQTLKIN